MGERDCLNDPGLLLGAVIGAAAGYALGRIEGASLAADARRQLAENDIWLPNRDLDHG